MMKDLSPYEEAWLIISKTEEGAILLANMIVSLSDAIDRINVLEQIKKDLI